MKLTRALCGLALSSTAMTALACEYPPLVMIPDTADVKPDAGKIREETETYAAAMLEYVACIQAEIEAAGDDAPKLQKAILIARNNTAVNELQAITDLFKERIGPMEGSGAENLRSSAARGGSRAPD